MKVTGITKTFKALAIVFAVVGAGVGISLHASPAHATSATDFQAGHIIDDAVFYNSHTLDVDPSSGKPYWQGVQDFITNHTPTCDTWGTQPSGYGNLTRAQYAQQVMGWPGPPYVCLQNYYEDPNTGSTSYENGGGAFAGGESAGKIIYDAAQQYGINPEVLLVTLKKESPGPLFSDSWPLKSQYRYAMGYACPDSGPNYSASCVASQAGFYKQVYTAAWQLRYYVNNITQYNYQPGRWNYIQYSTDPSCGGQNVYIDNVATASLYIYTPYVPNQASLQAYPGSAYCGSYGNRNFFMFFNEWFGSTYGSVQITTPLKITSSVPQGTFTGRTITASFDIVNTTTSYQFLGNMMTMVRDSAGGNHDFGTQSTVLAPGSTYHYVASTTLPTEDTYTFTISNYNATSGWSTNFPVSSDPSNVRSVQTFVQAMPTIEQVPTASSELRAGKTVNMSFAVKNNSTKPFDFGAIDIAVRGPASQNLDLPYMTPGPIAGGATLSYSQPFTPQSAGQYKFFVALTTDNGRTWNDSNFPALGSSVISNQAVQSMTVKPSPSVTVGLQLPSTAPRVGQKTTLSYTVTNFGPQAVSLGSIGLFVRNPLGGNADPRWDTVTVQPNSTYVYAVDIYPNKPGDWKVAIGGYVNNVWTTNITAFEPGVTQSGTISVLPNPTIKTGVTLSPAQPRVGQDATLQYVIQNDGDIPATVELTGAIIRDSKGNNLDSGWDAPTIAPHSTYTYTRVIRFANPGNASINIGGKLNGQWVMSPIPSVDSTVQQSQQINVLPSPTLTQGITFTDAKTVGPHAITFTVTNYGAAPVILGKMGLMVRDPQGRNYDPLWQDFTVAANSSQTYSATVNFDKTGVWTLTVGNYNGSWNTVNPVSENAQVIRNQQVTIN